MASSALSIAQVASRIHNVAQVRAAMGAVTLTLSQGYAQLDQLTTVYGVQDDARYLLDMVNKSAGILYHIYTDDPDLQAEEISVSHAISAGRIISDANDALKTIEGIANERLFDLATIVGAALDQVKVEFQTVGKGVGDVVQGATNAVAAGVSAFAFAAWPTILLVAVGATVYVYRKPLLAALAKVGQ